MTLNPLDSLGLTQKLRAIADQEIPRFSAAEMGRRRSALEAVMAERGVTHLLVYGNQRAGGAVGWLSGWPITTEAALVMTPGRRDKMFIQFHNHVPQAKLLAADTDVEWGGPNTMARLGEELDARGASTGKLGVMGPLGFSQAKILSSHCQELVDMGRDYVRLRMSKSAEELDWMRIGCAMTDAGMKALGDVLAPGKTESELADAIERAYIGAGGITGIHFIGATQMSNPSVFVPRQFHSQRRVQVGDAVTSEITANFWDYGGQILRSFSVGTSPTQLYRDLHAAGTEAFNRITKILRPGTKMEEIVAAAGVIEEAGFTICDDLVHGFGGGYLPPVLGSKSRPAGPLPDVTLRENMTLVVQPNVITREQTAGIQMGECFLITPQGCESLHKLPRDFRQV
jgi:Xaa-Pro dipeptidase